MPTPHRDLLDSARPITNFERIMHAPGSVIGNRYQIIQRLGRKEMGKTYLVKDLQATGDARCVIEQLSLNSDNQGDWELIEQRLVEEVKVLERLGDHPQIPQFYNYFFENQQFYLAREYIDGDNLEQEVERRIFEEADVIFLIQDILIILDFIHKINVVHRDIQPINIVRRKQDQSFVLVNFGTIRELANTSVDVNQDAIAPKSLGNWAYIAPEQKIGQVNLTSDLYALANTAVYALTGRSLQAWSQNNQQWQQQCQISKKLETILTKMMSSSIEARYGSALDVLTELRPLLRIRQLVGGRYRITHYLGQNEGVDTYLADNLRRQYQSPCLIKLIELASNHSDSKIKIERRFGEELSILEKLGYHDQIPQLWDHGEENDEFYLVQAYIPGESLANIIQEQDLSIQQIIKILISTLVVLGYSHQNRIIHRNLQPENILIRQEDQQVILTDFGILKDIKTLSYKQIDSSQRQDNYASPEQIAGRPTLSSDLYALGMIIIEAITKVKPSQFKRDIETGKLNWQSKIDVDRRLSKIINRMIELDLGKRYQSAEQVISDLQKINLLSPSKIAQPNKVKSLNLAQIKLRVTPLIIGLLGIIFLLCSIEFAFPTLRPIYYWYQGKKNLIKHPDSALNIFTLAIDLKPTSVLGWFGRGEALYKLERYPEALAAYSEATRLKESEFRYWQKQGDTLYQLERYTEAIAVYNRALELEPNQGELYNSKGRALYQLENYPKALEMQESALKFDQHNPQFMSDRAKNLLALKRYSEALSEFNRLRAIKPLNVQLWEDKSLVLTALNRPQEAATVIQEVIQAYQSILQKQKLDSKVWLDFANFLATNKIYQPALNSYKQVIKLKPDFYQAWLGKGKVLTQLNQEESALTALNQALQIRPQSYLALQAKGLIYQNQGNLSSAIALFDQAVKINPNYAPLWRDRGIALKQQGNYNQAIKSFTQANKITSWDLPTWVNLATVWEILDQDKQALFALDRALKLDPSNVDIWSQKGAIYTQNAQYNEACDTYRQSRKIIPNSEVIFNSMTSLGCRLQ
ncbi:serine/threonine protein kinase containing TPR domain [Chondrocystis sp. NIES-4102]|nr:serine/threonine protein kinase containing TPR domain [Chondrocystis sp. NIES-4102]